MQIVNSEHKSDCMNSAFSLRKELRNPAQSARDGESEWWLREFSGVFERKFYAAPIGAFFSLKFVRSQVLG